MFEILLVKSINHGYKNKINVLLSFSVLCFKTGLGIAKR